LTITKGDVVRIDDWTANARGQLFVVLSVDEPSDRWPKGVARLGLIEHFPGRDYPRGRTGAFRALPIERVRKDEKATRRWAP
jgi:hypothetical protein